MNNKDHNYYLEVLLQVLYVLSTSKAVDMDYIWKFEKLYLGLADGTTQYTHDQLREIYHNIDGIQRNLKYSDSKIFELMKLRRERNNKGATVVRNLFVKGLEYYQNKKNILMREAEELLSQEERLNSILIDTIQEVDQQKIWDEMIPIRERYRKASDEIMACQYKIDEIKNKIKKKWYYEIYGTFSHDKIRELLHSNMSN